MQAQTVEKIEQRGRGVWITTGDGSEYGSCAVLIATGADYRYLGVEGEEVFIGAGVHFCSTCDGPFYQGHHVTVVGGGNSAAEEAVGLLRFADRVTLLVRGGSTNQVASAASEGATAALLIREYLNTI